jgi:hypothetical protein
LICWRRTRGGRADALATRRTGLINALRFSRATNVPISCLGVAWAKAAVWIVDWSAVRAVTISAARRASGDAGALADFKSRFACFGRFSG